jgi:hypothetical protein
MKEEPALNVCFAKGGSEGIQAHIREFIERPYSLQGVISNGREKSDT